MHRAICLAVAIAASCIAGESQAAEVQCSPTTEVDVSSIGTRIVIVGERHGTTEIPAFVERLVCSFLRMGRPVILALETDGAEQAAVNRYLDSDGLPADRSTYLVSARWQDECQDGRKSVAMLALIDAMRRWRQAGQRVGVATIGPNENVSAPLSAAEESSPLSVEDAVVAARANDRILAGNALLTAAQFRPYTIVALTGFLHASTLKGNARDPEYLPTGYLVAQQLPTFTIAIETGPGSSWNQTAGGCGASAIAAQKLYSDGTKTDAVVRLQTVTASPPAKDAR